MGNSVATGYVVDKTGLVNTVGFQQMLGEAMYLYSIEPWDPRDLLQTSLQKQAELCKTSPLRFIQVGEGLRFYASQIGFLRGLTRERFVHMSLELFRQKGLHLPAGEATVFYDVFDAVDLYKNATLSVGELVGGLSSFLGGTIDQKTKAVFDCLAVGQGFVHKSALQKFLKPFVWCMVPQEAEVLRPILLSQVTEDIFADISISGKDSISEQEMTRWLHKGQYGSPHQKMLSMTIAERAAMSIAMAVTVAWERYEAKQKLRTYGQQTWQEDHGRSQYLTDVGAYRYTTQHASNVMSKASHAASSSASASVSMFSSIAESSSQLLQKAQTWLAEEDDEDDDDSASLAMPPPTRPLDMPKAALTDGTREEKPASGVPQMTSVQPKPMRQNASIASKSMSPSTSSFMVPPVVPRGQIPTLLGRY
jgi:phage baseplate assembly protein W